MSEPPAIDPVALRLAENTGLTPAQGADFIRALVATAVAHLRSTNGAIQIIGLGVFQVAERPERTGTNPATGAPLVIPKKFVLKCRVADEANEALGVPIPDPDDDDLHLLSKGETPVDAIAACANLSKPQVLKCLGAIPSIAYAEMLTPPDHSFTLPGLGRFELRCRPVRYAMNPKTQEKLRIPPCHDIRCWVAKEAKDAVFSHA